MLTPCFIANRIMQKTVKARHSVYIITFAHFLFIFLPFFLPSRLQQCTEIPMFKRSKETENAKHYDYMHSVLAENTIELQTDRGFYLDIYKTNLRLPCSRLSYMASIFDGILEHFLNKEHKKKRISFRKFSVQISFCFNLRTLNNIGVIRSVLYQYSVHCLGKKFKGEIHFLTRFL